MAACSAIVPNTSLLLRGFAEALTLSGLVRSSLETGRVAITFFTFFVGVLFLLGITRSSLSAGREVEAAAHNRGRGRRQVRVASPQVLRAARSAGVAPGMRGGSSDPAQRGQGRRVE